MQLLGCIECSFLNRFVVSSTFELVKGHLVRCLFCFWVVSPGFPTLFMLKRSMKRHIHRRLVWMLWVVTSSIGLAAGLSTSLFFFANTASSWILVFASIGAGVGMGQFLTLYVATRRNPSSFVWFLLTVLGFTVGGLLGYPLEDTALIGALIGLSVGIAQWLILGKWAGVRSLVWIIVNALAGSLALAIADAIMRSLSSFEFSIGIAAAIAILPTATVIIWILPAHEV